MLPNYQNRMYTVCPQVKSSITFISDPILGPSVYKKNEIDVN